MCTKSVAIIIVVSVIFTKAEELISNETFPQDITISGSESVFEQVIKPCCLIGDHHFYSLDRALHSLTNDSIVKVIASIALLNSKVSIKNLENIAIVGHGTLTVSCSGIGAISFSFCNNVTIKDVVWENCGSSNKSTYPGIGFHKSSNLTVQNCKFHSSITQALTFSEPSGNIYISNCKFTQNEHSGHGAAVEYISAATARNQTRLMIDRCEFSNNGAAKSIVYINSVDKPLTSYLQDSLFIGNKGVPLYVSHHKLHIQGDLIFKHNLAVAGGGILSSDSVVVFKSTSNVTFYSNSAITNGGAMFINDSRIRFGENSVIHFANNFAKLFGGTLFSMNKSVVSFGGNTMATFHSNKAGECGGALHFSKSNLSFDENSKVIFTENESKYGGAVYSYNSQLSFDRDKTVTSEVNKAIISGGVIFPRKNSSITFNSNIGVTFSDNQAQYGGAVYLRSYSIISFDGHTKVIYNSNKVNISGGAIYSDEKCHITFDSNSMVLFYGNRAARGGAVFSRDYSNIAFDGNTTVTYEGNKARKKGGAVYSSRNSNIMFDQNSKVTFTGNFAVLSGGSVYSESYSNISFDGKTTVSFKGNKAILLAGSILSNEKCNITFDGNSKVTFSNNRAQIGAAIFSHSYSKMSFDGNTRVTCDGNKASKTAGAIHALDNCSITFDGNSKVVFSDNTAYFGGAVYTWINAIISFDGNTTVTYNSNKASEDGGAVYSSKNCNITFNGNSKVTFSNNKAQKGGAVYSGDYSTVLFDGTTSVLYKDNVGVNGAAAYYSANSVIRFDGNSTVTYKHNEASNFGGAENCFMHCNITFNGDSKVIFGDNRAKHGGAVNSEFYSIILFVGHTTVTFYNNKASTNGGTIHSHDNSNITFDKHSVVTFYDNSATYGGAVLSTDHSIISFDGNTTVICKGNKVGEFGGVIGLYKHSRITVNGNSNITLSNNEAKYGGAVFFGEYSEILFDGNGTVACKSNKASENGGVIISNANCRITFNGNSNVSFRDNEATAGGAMSCNKYSYLLFQRNSKVEFTNNIAKDGGALEIQQSNMYFTMGSLVKFNENSANRSGGAIYLGDNYTIIVESESDVIFHQNNAIRFGGAIYGELKQTNHSKVLMNTTSVEFSSNTSPMGDNAYMHLQASCDETCLNSSIVGLNVTHNFPPQRLALYNPATCVNPTDTLNDCNTYFVNNIMVGQNIKINACALSFHDRPAEGENFVVSGESQHHRLDGTRFVPIACKLFEGVSVIGEKISNKTNFSLTITSYSSEIEISVGLIAELSPCHPGFFYERSTEQCVCYDDSDVVSCSGSTSTIKRGYWFGVVDGKRTLAVCPNNYCNFSCCETTNGFHQLSPVRTNQCSSHRSGTACGSCEEGYTLSFDSAKCVSVNKCTTFQTVLVIMLSVTYWIALVVIVFVVTYYHIEIGYFYVITYYYSMLDILLDQNLYASQELFTVVSIMSSAAKVTPQFLGQLCLAKNISGIDQQVIHYAHPLAVTVIVGIICLSARMSYRFSAFVSRRIIRIICCLLLLSYTSVATTSLLLLRSLAFHDVDKVYTYLSPNVEYFHGRHLPYGIMAILCTLVIVIGLPLLLLSEPFLNCKINFTRIKPLLDQFQGCYKDKYRSFAAYYMICRLVIIIIIIINSANTNATLALLLVTSTLLALTQLVTKPYKHRALNIFDGIVLHIMIFPSVISFFDRFNTGLLSAVITILVILPLIAFVTMELIVYKENFKKIIVHCKIKPVTTKDNDEVQPISDIGLVIDDNMRKNATIVDM